MRSFTIAFIFATLLAVSAAAIIQNLDEESADFTSMDQIVELEVEPVHNHGCPFEKKCFKWCKSKGHPGGHCKDAAFKCICWQKID